MKHEIFDLTAIGMSDDVLTAFLPYAGKGLTLGRVSAVHREQYGVYTAAGELRAEAIGSLLFHAKAAADLPAIGDWVALQTVSESEAMVHAVLPRHSVFSRQAAGDRTEQQIIATNIDLVFVVCGLDGDFNPRRMERYVTSVRECGADPIIILNKSDICDCLPQRIAETERIASGASVIPFNARSGSNSCLIRDRIGGSRTGALTGSSGVGKSTILNLLLGEERQVVRDVRESDSRGRHTTTHRELVPLPGGGALIDSPGMRELQLWAGKGSLDSAFDDIGELAAQCRFRDCTHHMESGCAVRERVDAARLESYHKLQAEIAWHGRKENVHSAQAQKQRWKAIHKAMRSSKTRFPYT